jgi:hypothetical protein
VSKQVMEQALEALRISEGFIDRHSENWYTSGQHDLARVREAIVSLKEAIKQQDEPQAMCTKGRAFKDYVHQRLDAMGVPHSLPESEHDKAGCRVGGRLDWVEARIEELEGETK